MLGEVTAVPQTVNSKWAQRKHSTEAERGRRIRPVQWPRLKNRTTKHVTSRHVTLQRSKRCGDIQIVLFPMT